jgi:hypothetical protein
MDPTWSVKETPALASLVLGVALNAVLALVAL